MRFGINTFLFTFPFTNASTKWFKTFKKWGFDTVEIAIDDPGTFDAAYVKAELDEVGLPCGSACGCFGPDRDLRGDAAAQQNSLRYLQKVIDQMVVLDCPRLIGPAYSAVGRIGGAEPGEYKKQWATVVKNLRKICAYAEKKGKQICLEPLNRFETDFINTVDQALQMVHDVGSPALKIHLDTFHMNIEEKCQGDAIRKAGKHLSRISTPAAATGAPPATMWRVFIDEYLKTWSATEAAKRAGYSERTAYSMGSRLLKNVEVDAAIKQRITEAAMGPDEVLHRLGEQARVDVGDFYDPATNTVDMRRAIATGKSRLIKKIKQTVRTTDTEEIIHTEIELVDSQNALIHIGKHHKLFTERNETDVTLNLVGLDALLEKVYGNHNSTGE